MKNAAAYQRERRELNRATPFDQIPHGANGYSNYDCRCETCRAANATRQREYVAEQKRDGVRSHGTPGYAAGCRCEVCRSAKSAQAARYRARRKSRRAEGGAR